MSQGEQRLTALEQRILQEIADSPARAIDFARFMEQALYEPELGYYSDPDRVVGRSGGDFYTSVSVGDLFGRLLARGAADRWREQGRPEVFTLVEQGAHDGRLASDILAAASENSMDRGFAAALRYVILEPRERHRRRLEQKFARAGVGGVELRSGREPVGGAGIFLCNELVDAFPVHRIVRRGGQWRELFVAAAAGMAKTPLPEPAARDTDAAAEPDRQASGARFVFEERDIPADSALGSEVGRLHEVAREENVDSADEGWGWPEGYTTEVNVEMLSWMRQVSRFFDGGQGCWWIFDYGHRSGDYYAPHRREGTLRCYHRHRADDDPLERVGEKDITAHVDFGRLQRAAQDCGLACPSGLVDQHDFLTRLAMPWMQDVEQRTVEQGRLSELDQGRVRQFQTLTHPGMMGRVFKVLELHNGGTEA